MPSLTAAQEDELKAAFEMFDKDGSGDINTQELGLVMRSMGQSPTDEELDQIIADVDEDGGGSIDFSEFLTLMSKRMKDSDEEEEIEEAFKIFDKNKDGTISSDDLAMTLTDLGWQLPDDEVAEMFKEGDIDAMGAVRFEEFKELAMFTDKPEPEPEEEPEGSRPTTAGDASRPDTAASGSAPGSAPGSRPGTADSRPSTAESRPGSSGDAGNATAKPASPEGKKKKKKKKGKGKGKSKAEEPEPIEEGGNSTAAATATEAATAVVPAEGEGDGAALSPDSAAMKKKRKGPKRGTPEYFEWLKRRRVAMKAKWRQAFLTVTFRRYYATLKDYPGAPRPLYRMACLHFAEGEYAEAAERFEECSSGRKKDHKMWRMYGQAELRLFQQDKKHEHLEMSHKCLHRAMTLRPQDLESLIDLPHSLIELSEVYESYGAFEGALEILGRLTEFFPHIPRFDECMFRCVLIMKHLGGLPGAPSKALYEKCVEFCDVLLEERIVGGPSPQTERPEFLWIYAQVCEAEGSMISEIKAGETYDRIFKARVADKKPDTDKWKGWRKWLKDPDALMAMGKEFRALGLNTLAAELFDEAAQGMVERATRYKSLGISVPIDFDTLVEIAQTYADFQDMETALNYAVSAYELEEFNPKVRHMLGSWDKSYHELFATQELAAVGVQRHWRRRVWSYDYMLRYKEMRIVEWEATFTENHWDLEVRDKLTYFLKAKWRCLFLFEAASATRIQHWRREMMTRRHWLAAQKKAHLTKCASLYAKWARHPYDLDIRAECVQLAGHRLTPPDHNLKKLELLFQAEHEAAAKMQRQYQRVRAARRVAMMREAKRIRDELERQEMALRIQCSVRQHQARIILSAKQVHQRNRVALALVLQKMYRAWQGRWNLMLKLMEMHRAEIEAERREEASIRLQSWARGTGARFMVKVTWKHAALDIQRSFHGYVARRNVKAWKYELATRIQRAYREMVERQRWQALLRRLIEQKNAPPAPLSLALQARLGSILNGAGTAIAQQIDAENFSLVEEIPSVLDVAAHNPLQPPHLLPKIYTDLPSVTTEPQLWAGVGEGLSSELPQTGRRAIWGHRWSGYISPGIAGTPARALAVTKPIMIFTDPAYEHLMVKAAASYLGETIEEEDGSVGKEAVGGDGGQDDQSGSEDGQSQQSQLLAPLECKEEDRLQSPATPGADGAAGGWVSNEFVDRSEIERNANGCEEPSSRDPELWNVDNAEVDYLVKYKMGGQMWYLQSRMRENSAKGKPIPGFPMNQKARDAKRHYVCDEGEFNAESSSLSNEGGSALSHIGGGLKRSRADDRFHDTSGRTFGNIDASLVESLLKDGNCNLRVLCLLGADLSDPVAGEALAAGLVLNRSVRVLVLAGCKCHPDGLVAIMSALSRDNFTLRHLLIDTNDVGAGANLGPLAGIIIGDFFRAQFGQLVSLSLCKMGLVDDDAEAIGKGLKASGLTHLYLSENFISDPGGVMLAEGITEAKWLMDVDLAENRLTSDTAFPILKHMRFNRSALRRLDLSGNLIKDDIVSLAIGVLQMNVEVYEIGLKNNMFRDYYVDEYDQAATAHTDARQVRMELEAERQRQREEEASQSSKTWMSPGSQSGFSDLSARIAKLPNSPGDLRNEVRSEGRRKRRADRSRGSTGEGAGAGARGDSQRSGHRTPQTRPSSLGVSFNEGQLGGLLGTPGSRSMGSLGSQGGTMRSARSAASRGSKAGESRASVASSRLGTTTSDVYHQIGYSQTGFFTGSLSGFDLADSIAATSGRPRAPCPPMFSKDKVGAGPSTIGPKGGSRRGAATNMLTESMVQKLLAGAETADEGNPFALSFGSAPAPGDRSTWLPPSPIRSSGSPQVLKPSGRRRRRRPGEPVGVSPAVTPPGTTGLRGADDGFGASPTTLKDSQRPVLPGSTRKGGPGGSRRKRAGTPPKDQFKSKNNPLGLSLLSKTGQAEDKPFRDPHSPAAIAKEFESTPYLKAEFFIRDEIRELAREAARASPSGGVASAGAGTLPGVPVGLGGGGLITQARRR